METLDERNSEITGILSACGLGGCPKSANPRPATTPGTTQAATTRIGEAITNNAVPILLGLIALELAYIAWRLK